MTPEGKVKKEVKKGLAQRQVFFYMPVQNGMGRTGVSDFIGCHPMEITPDMVGSTVGVFFAIEAKKDEETEPTSNQETFLKEVAAAHGITGVFGSQDVNKLHALFDAALAKYRRK